MSFSVDGKTAIVTGAANGIGLAIARHLLDVGANVMFADIDEERLADELGDDRNERNVGFFAGDLRERLTLANLMSATLDAFDRVDILVNASRQVYVSDEAIASDEAVEQALQQNLMTSLKISRLVVRRFITQSTDEADAERPAGSIINISSIAARLSHPKLMPFSIATAALDQMTRSMAVALAPERIRVNGVAFGSVMSNSLMMALKEHPEYRDPIVNRTPLSRIAGASELVETVQYLASDASGFVTGQILTVDGGRTLLDPVTAPAH
jgi:7-alpha-hydroxysteroid dehydrogenase